MTKTIVASTFENNEKAVDEILSGLEIKESLLKNSLGIIACHKDFVTSGVMKKVCDALPFDVIGAISSLQSTGDKTGKVALSIMLITTDEARFVNVVTPSLEDNFEQKIMDCYKQAATGVYGRASLVLAYWPFMYQYSGDDCINALSVASYGAPCFGTIAVDDSDDFSGSFTIFNGEHYNDRLVFSLVFGNIKPKFYIANISLDKMFEKSAKVTKSSGTVISEIDSRPAFEFFEELGILEAFDSVKSLLVLPFLIDFHDNTPMVAKQAFGLTVAKRIQCNGTVPEGSTLHVATNERTDILNTTGAKVDEFLKEAGEANGLLIYSCISRSWVMGDRPHDEADLINFKINELGKKLPTFIAYSGGEICPTTSFNDKAINRFHNNTFVACLF
ncbi:MAG: FIST C-terminal domain-containing protein [Defluviitaleaceae bacterium]|nr:FIST C-terminal domain-containing protein [Defluviitaleaceae bacterium]